MCGRRKRFYKHGQEHRFHIVVDALLHSCVGFFLRDALFFCIHKFVVLRADYDGVHAHRAVGGAIVFHRHLALGVGAQIRKHVPLAEFCQFNEQKVSQIEGERQITCRFGARVAKHHTLVAGTLQGTLFAVHTAVNVARLLMDGSEHAARTGIELVFAFVVANAINHLPCHFGQIDVSRRFHFAGKHHLSGGNEGFARHFRLWVESEKLVENSIANLIGNLIGMPFRNGF